MKRKHRRVEQATERAPMFVPQVETANPLVEITREHVLERKGLEREVERLKSEVDRLRKDATQANESMTTIAKQRDREHDRAVQLLDAHRDVIGALRLLTTGADSNRFAIEDENYKKKIQEMERRS
jgi:hypothetical protein